MMPIIFMNAADCPVNDGGGELSIAMAHSNHHEATNRSVRVVSISEKGSVLEPGREDKKHAKKKRHSMGAIAMDPLSYLGPWAGFQGENVGPSKATPQEIAEHAEKVAKISMQTSIRPLSGVTGRDVDFDEDAAASSIIDRLSTYVKMGKEYSQFHGGLSQKDYLGRTYMDAPISLPNSSPQACFLPKKCIHIWEGHQKAVSSIRLLPDTGHLLLSCSFDSKIKVSSDYHSYSSLALGGIWG